MPTHTHHTDRECFYFVTFTCYQWLNLFSETDIYDFMPFWFSKLKENNCLPNGYVIMPNHLHMVVYVKNNCKGLNKVISGSKRFLAYEIVKRLKDLNKVDILKELERGVQDKERVKGKKHQVFRLSFDAKLLSGNLEVERVLDYIHHNPVSKKWNLATDFVDYKYSSAKYYEIREESEIQVYDYREMTASESLSGDSE